MKRFKLGNGKENWTTIFLKCEKNRMLILLAMVLGILAKRLGLSPPPELATFGLTVEGKKRKRTELIKEVFVTKNIRVDGMDKNLIPPSRIMPIQGLVINETESEIFFMNMKTNIEARSDCIKAREIVEKNLDNVGRKIRIQVTDIVKEVEDYLKTRSSAGMDMSWFLNDGEGNSSEFMLLGKQLCGENGAIQTRKRQRELDGHLLEMRKSRMLILLEMVLGILAKRLGLSPPHELTTFGLTADEKKRKRTELIKEVFVTENFRVDGMDRNLIPPPRILPIQCLVINEPERIQVTDIVKEVEDYLKTRSSAGMDMSWYVKAALMISEMLRSRFLNNGEGDSIEFMLSAYNGNNAGDGEIVDQQINNDVGNGVLDQDLGENPVGGSTLKAQSQKWTENEAKNSKMIQEYKRQISFRADTQPITKISYVVNFKKEATIKITRGDNPLNLVVHPNFRLKTLGFSEWLVTDSPFREVLDDQRTIDDPWFLNDGEGDSSEFILLGKQLWGENGAIQTRKRQRELDGHLLEMRKKHNVDTLSDGFGNFATLKAQSQKWTEHEAKNAKMMQEYKRQISFRADTLPITKISYVVNFKKEATIKITRGDNPLNLVVHPNFRLKTLGFSEWLVINQAKRLGLSPPPELATFGLTAEEKKRKRTGLIKEVFVTENVRVDGMDRNLIPLFRIMPIQCLVINEPESGIFFMNMNTNIEARSDYIKAREIVEKNLDNVGRKIRIQVTDIVKEVEDYLKTCSSAGIDMSWFLNDGEGDSSEFMLLAYNGNNAGYGEIVDQQVNNDVGNGVLDQDLGENPVGGCEPTTCEDNQAYRIINKVVISIYRGFTQTLVINQAKRLGLSPPPELATFGLTAEEKKRKRTKLIKEVFVTKNFKVDGMDRNLIPPPRIMPIQGLVINKPESGIFFMDMNTNIGFQRETEFHLTNQGGLRDCYGDVLKDELCEKRSAECKASAGSERTLLGLSLIEQHQTYSSHGHCQGSRRLLEDTLVSWDGYEL
nr:hypothetical protein [Tanacetum cinerariifolium]